MRGVCIRLGQEVLVCTSAKAFGVSLAEVCVSVAL